MCFTWAVNILNFPINGNYEYKKINDLVCRGNESDLRYSKLLVHFSNNPHSYNSHAGANEANTLTSGFPPSMHEEWVTVLCVRLGPLDDGLEEEEEECVSEGNELAAKEEFSAEENFTTDFEAENLGCEDMEYFCAKGQRVKRQRVPSQSCRVLKGAF